MELYHGSPADMTGRSAREIRTYAFLDDLGIQFDRTDHPDEPAEIYSSTFSNLSGPTPQIGQV